MARVVDDGGLVLDTLINFTSLDLGRFGILVTFPIGTFDVFLLFEFHQLFHTILLIVIIFDPERILVLLLPFLFSELGDLFLLIGELSSEEITINLPLLGNRPLSISAR